MRVKSRIIIILLILTLKRNRILIKFISSTVEISAQILQFFQVYISTVLLIFSKNSISLLALSITTFQNQTPVVH